MAKTYLPKESIEYAKENKINEWVDDFLRTEGKNKALANGLKKQKRFWFGPEQFPLSDLKRCCGPEKDMEYYEDAAAWKNRVDKLISYIRKGNELPPLIVHYVNGELSIRDGSHRYEAYVKIGFDKYWTLIWFDSKSDLKLFKQKYCD